MNKEYETIIASIKGKNPKIILSLADSKDKIITVCHRCGIIYTAEKRDFVTTTVAENTAWDHGNFFNPGHHVSVVSVESTKTMEETLAINEKCQPRVSTRKPLPFIPPEMYK